LPNAKATIRPGSILNRQGGSIFDRPEQAGIAGASSHSMRRTFLTSLASKGISIRVLASLAGHRSVQVTMKYLDASDDMKRNAVEMI